MISFSSILYTCSVFNALHTHCERRTWNYVHIHMDKKKKKSTHTRRIRRWKLNYALHVKGQMSKPVCACAFAEIYVQQYGISSHRHCVAPFKRICQLNSFIFGFRELFKLCITFHLLPFTSIKIPIAHKTLAFFKRWKSLSTFFLSLFSYPFFLPYTIFNAHCVL